MTDLDLFATAALQGLLAIPDCEEVDDVNLAKRAYEVAWAMHDQRDHCNGVIQFTLTAKEQATIMSAIWDFEQAGCTEDADTLFGIVERFGQTPVTKPMPIEISAEVSSHPTSDRIYVSSKDASD